METEMIELKGSHLGRLSCLPPYCPKMLCESPREGTCTLPSRAICAGTLEKFGFVKVLEKCWVCSKCYVSA